MCVCCVFRHETNIDKLQGRNEAVIEVGDRLADFQVMVQNLFLSLDWCQNSIHSTLRPPHSTRRTCGTSAKVFAAPRTEGSVSTPLNHHPKPLGPGPSQNNSHSQKFKTRQPGSWRSMKPSDQNSGNDLGMSCIPQQSLIASVSLLCCTSKVWFNVVPFTRRRQKILKTT